MEVSERAGEFIDTIIKHYGKKQQKPLPATLPKDTENISEVPQDPKDKYNIDYSKWLLGMRAFLREIGIK